jgi:opacity protein-like surface antigen
MHILNRALRDALLFVVGTVGTTAAQAQGMPSDNDDGDTSEMRWEITPFVGYRMGGDFDISGAPGGGDLDDQGSFALAVNLAVDETTSYELFYSRQEASFAQTSAVAPFDLNVEYLHVGGTLLLSDELPIAPYMVGGLGLTRFSPQTGPGSDDSRFSVSLGAGVKMPVTRNFAVRLEARGFVTFVDSESAFFCVSDSQGGACAIQAKTDSFFQYELLAGATFSF